MLFLYFLLVCLILSEQTCLFCSISKTLQYHLVKYFSCSTIGAIVMTPLLTKLLAGQLVPVDAAVRTC